MKERIGSPVRACLFHQMEIPVAKPRRILRRVVGLYLDGGTLNLRYQATSFSSMNHLSPVKAQIRSSGLKESKSDLIFKLKFGVWDISIKNSTRQKDYLYDCGPFPKRED